jgi:hypothetical protein
LSVWQKTGRRHKIPATPEFLKRDFSLYLGKFYMGVDNIKRIMIMFGILMHVESYFHIPNNQKIIIKNTMSLRAYSASLNMRQKLMIIASAVGLLVFAAYILAASSFGKAPYGSTNFGGAFSLGPLEVYASSGSTFLHDITAGTLAIDIVNGSYTSVSNPRVYFATSTFSFSCNTSTGTFGATSTESIYVQNPDAADNGWTVSLAANNTTDVWTTAGTPMDFNEAGSGGCVDDGATTDADSYAGKLTINPSAAVLQTGACASCGTGNISLGSQAEFVEGATDSVTLLTAASGSDDIGDWLLNGVIASQTIPGEQPAASDYAIDMVLSIVAS